MYFRVRRLFNILYVMLIFARLVGFLIRFYQLFYCWVFYLPMLISHSFLLARFCFKTNLTLSVRSSFLKSSFFSKFVFLLCISSGAKLSLASVLNYVRATGKEHNQQFILKKISLLQTLYYEIMNNQFDSINGYFQHAWSLFSWFRNELEKVKNEDFIGFLRPN